MPHSVAFVGVQSGGTSSRLAGAVEGEEQALFNNDCGGSGGGTSLDSHPPTFDGIVESDLPADGTGSSSTLDTRPLSGSAVVVGGSAIALEGEGHGLSSGIGSSSSGSRTSPKERAPTINRGAITLDLPADGETYSQIEVIEYAVAYGKNAVIAAINSSGYKPKRTKLHKYFPPRDGWYESDIIHALLQKYEFGSKEWCEQVERISSERSHGPTKATIYNICGYNPLDDEVANINANANTSIALCPTAEPARTISPDSVAVDLDNNSANEFRPISSTSDESSNTSKTTMANASTSVRSSNSSNTDLANITMGCTSDESSNTSNTTMDNASTSVRSSNSSNIDMANDLNYSNIATLSSNPKKRRREDFRSNAVNALAPRFKHSGNIDEMEWRTDETQVKSWTTTNDSKDLRTALMAISKGSAEKAGLAIARLLSNESNRDVKSVVLKKIQSEDKDAATCKMIVSGIKKSIAHHTNPKGGTRTTAAETFVKNVTTACLFDVVELKSKISNATISRLIGSSLHQVSLAFCRVQDLLADGSMVTKLQCKQRKDYIRDKVKPSIYHFGMSDDVSRCDTNQKPVEVINPITNEVEKVSKRIWKCINKKGQHLQYLESEEYKQFQAEHSYYVVLID